MIHYRYHKGREGEPLFILLHGTGGDEESLLPLVSYLNPHANVLALRGQVSENGALRFFKRHSEGQFDLLDLEERGKQLMEELLQFIKEHNLSTDDTVLIGFSNGSNMAINLLLRDGSPFKRGILFAPMYPIDTNTLKESKEDTSVFISMGRLDPLVPLNQSQKVIREFQTRHAQVSSYWVKNHDITLDSLKAAHRWLSENQKPSARF
ncbi:alpha/beta hydrolase [Streptococcus pseudoporcinus]|uniref:Phospholipase/carboxylesterase n=1 Tax=Streptococcus pseudoporcinus LQ 940-04 TaxID=875093 RepID=G5K7K6_9STRE|nr:alpha/beta hydrolase [Streptococcus pseudoporcinus]EFR44383.1 phospholipase/carboxylesterase [Streptococcus pseudoporcinus SPIN 20026]EHI64132.1 phospholipase/carboxylesterase [Streptococcus pseudoporcinus LQ 940-04]VEF93926.1 phospholipase/carboxylesterase [Streptococcus pseudoporcinus]